MELYTDVLGNLRNYTPIYILYTNLLGYFKNFIISRHYDYLYTLIYIMDLSIQF